MTSRLPAALLHGRAVIVTGAARGVGKGIATALVDRSASVLLVDRDEELLSVTAEELGAEGHSVVPLVADLRDRDCAGHIVSAALDTFGGVHGVVSNAIATNEPKPFHAITREDYDLVFDVGPRATFELMQAVYPVFVGNGGGSIVNRGSGMWRETAPEAYERTVRGVPLGRLGDVGSDIGPVVCFLLSDESSFVTAQTIMVDGGAAAFR